MKFVVVFFALLAVAKLGFGQPACQSAFRQVQETGIPMTGIASGVDVYTEVVRESELGKTLERCPNLADLAWDTILKSGQDALKQKASYRMDEQVGILLTIYGDHLSERNLGRLKGFLRLKPWELGFGPFSPSIAVDALLAHEKDTSRHTQYHSYTPAEMEAVLAKYVH